MRQEFSLILPPPLAADAALFKSMVRGNAIEQRGEWTGDILQGGIEVTKNNVSGLRLVRQQRTESKHAESTSPLSLSLNEVLNSSLHLSILNESRNGNQQPATASCHQGGIDYGLDVQGGFQGNTVFNGTISETIQSYGVLNSADDLFSILNSSSMQPSYLKGEPTPNWVHTDNGNIRIDCTTNPASGGNPEGILGADAKLGPGWFSNVNWSDDDKDGYPGSLPPDNDAAYTPDKVDNFVTGGDKDLRKFKVYVSAHNNLGGHNWSFKLTFGAKVAVYEHNTKAGVVENNRTFVTGELTTEDAFTKSKTLWLEGQTGSDTVMDVQLTVTHVGNIPMLSLTDVVNVTVFEADPWGYFFGGEGGTAQAQNDLNSVKHSNPNMSPGTNDNNGMISWDDANGDGTKGDLETRCRYFANAMEVAASVKPLTSANYLVNNNIKYQWERERWGKEWLYVKDVDGQSGPSHHLSCSHH